MKRIKRHMTFLLAIALLLGVIGTNSITSLAAGNVTITGMGTYGSITIGDHVKKNTWWNIKVSGKDAFCLTLGASCHSGMTYEKTESFTWNQDTGGEKRGYYARIIRWYIVDRNRSKPSKIMSQALMWAVSSGINSKSGLTDIIKQVKNNTGYFPSRTPAELYSIIFEPTGNWTAEASYWKKTGSTAGYQTLLTVDAAEAPPTTYLPSTISKHDWYRQRIRVEKTDELGEPIEGITFSLTGHNMDELYSFSVAGKNGTEVTGNTDIDQNDTAFTMTDQTRADGSISFRMTYMIQNDTVTYYYSDSDLNNMTPSEKSAARSYLTDTLELTQGIDFGPNMTRAEAESLAEADLLSKKQKISNDYTLTEDDLGDNVHLYLDPVLHTGVDLTLTDVDSWFRNDDGTWPDSSLASPSLYFRAFKYDVTNIYKKANIKIIKEDSYSDDKKAHGDATLEGATFTLYDDAACTTKATVYDKDGNPREVGTYTVSGGTFDTDYLISGKTYYLKEISAPTGYLLSDTVTPIRADASGVTELTTDQISDVTIGNHPILGKVALQKYFNEDDPGILNPEHSVSFQVYLKSAGSFAKAHPQYERDLLVTDTGGYAITHDLYYGTYIVHQVDSGLEDTVKIDDFEMKVDEDGKTYLYALRNPYFKSFLKIIKKDKNTEKTILKAGTTYQIYQLKDGVESLITQSYSNGNKIVTVDRFVTDDTGEIATVQPLKSGTYRIYETDAVTGYRLAKKYVEVEINSHLQNYVVTTDANGDKHAVVTIEFENEETVGRFGLKKFGKFLKYFDTETHTFTYEDRALRGVTFEVLADGDVATQDANPTTWFKDGEVVAAIKAGESAEFTSNCGGLTKSQLLPDGTVELTLPLGKYIVKEKETPYGYVISDKEWHIEFMWQGQDIEIVKNITEDTDDAGNLNIMNDIPSISLTTTKKDKDSGDGIANTMFGLYTKNDIYNADGQLIVKADTLIDSFMTGTDGTFIYDKKLPCMDRGYGLYGTYGATYTPGATASPTVTGTPTVTGSPATGVNPNTIGKNSGDYYIKELMVSGSYYPDTTTKDIHLEYVDSKTVTLEATADFEDLQTEVNISKRMIASSEELPGAQLRILDKEGYEIISWTSGEPESITYSPILGPTYQNLKAEIAEDKSIIIRGLLHDVEYTLEETRPADGYVTAESIDFMIRQSIDGLSSIVAIKDDEIFSDESAVSGSSLSADTSSITEYHAKADNKVIMYDEETHILINKVDAKTKKPLAGAVIEIYDATGELVDTISSTEEGVPIDGKLIVGEIYTFKEVSAPKGYKLAKEVQYTIEDTADVQEVIIKDEKIKKAIHVPQTGMPVPLKTAETGLNLIMCIALMISVISYIRRRKKLTR